MKGCYQYLIISFLCFIAVSANAQTSDNRIAYIKKQFAQINQQLKNYRSKETTDDESSTESNAVTGWFDGKELKKITVTYYGETGKLNIEYYFDHNQLLFFYSAEQRYDRPYYVNPNAPLKTSITNEQRFYFDNDKIVSYVLKPAKKLNDKEVSDQKNEIFRDVRRLRAELK